MGRLVILGFRQQHQNRAMGGLDQPAGGGVDHRFIIHVVHRGAGLGGLFGEFADLGGDQRQGRLQRLFVQPLKRAFDQSGALHLLGLPGPGIAIKRFGGGDGVGPVAHFRRFRLGNAQTIEIGARQCDLARIQRFAQAREEGRIAHRFGKGAGLVQKRDFFKQARDLVFGAG